MVVRLPRLCSQARNDDWVLRRQCGRATSGRPYKGVRDLSGAREACCLSGGGTPPLQNVVLGKQKKEKWV